MNYLLDCPCFVGFKFDVFSVLTNSKEKKSGKNQKKNKRISERIIGSISHEVMDHLNCHCVFIRQLEIPEV